MIVILCSVSDNHGNDDILNGLVHFNLLVNLRNDNYMHAVYHLETRTMDLISEGGSRSAVQVKYNSQHTARYNCVHQLLSIMDSGDQLMVCSLSDLADNASDVQMLYFLFLAKGIQLSFFDASYLDTEMLKLNSDPSSDQKLMIQRIIQNYFACTDHKPTLISEAKFNLTNASNSKKKSHP